jgi:hypothetical protein
MYLPSGPFSSFSSPTRTAPGSSPTTNTYPYVDFFSPNSTSAERKSRSPRSPARISAAKPSQNQPQRRTAHFSAPNTPSRLRHAVASVRDGDNSVEESADEDEKGEGSPTLRSQRLRLPIPFPTTEVRSSSRTQSTSDARSTASSNPFFLSSSSSSFVALASKSSSNPTRPLPLPPTSTSNQPDVPAAKEWVPTLVSSQDPIPDFSLSPSPTRTVSPPTHRRQELQEGEEADVLELSNRPRKRVRYASVPVQQEEEQLEKGDRGSSGVVERPEGTERSVGTAVPSSSTSSTAGAAASSSLPLPSISLPSLPSSVLDPPPLRSSLRLADPAILDLPDTKYRNPYFSDPADVPRRVREYAGRRWPLSSKHGLEEDEFVSRKSDGMQKGKGKKGEVAWEARMIAPSRGDAEEWLKSDEVQKNQRTSCPHAIVTRS